MCSIKPSTDSDTEGFHGFFSVFGTLKLLLQGTKDPIK